MLAMIILIKLDGGMKYYDHDKTKELEDLWKETDSTKFLEQCLTLTARSQEQAGLKIFDVLLEKERHLFYDIELEEWLHRPPRVAPKLEQDETMV